MVQDGKKANKKTQGSNIKQKHRAGLNKVGLYMNK